MLEKKQIRFTLILCMSVLAACQPGPLKTERLGNSNVTETPSAETVNIDEPIDEPATPAPSLLAADASTYQDAVNLASGAFTLGQQAQSPDDWDLIVGRWEQAIEKLQAVPANHQHYGMAQTKLKEYERNLSQARQRLATSQQPVAEITLAKPAAPTAIVGAAASTPTAGSSVPIIERRGGTPVIEVSFNGKPYPMILDTGASHTHITRAMANELGVQVLGQTAVTTASSNRVLVDVGNIQSIRVGSITRSDIPISIGDAVPIGLLGNDVYKDFDVILQANSVEFQPR